MLYVRDIPDPSAIREFAARYPDVDPSAALVYLTLQRYVGEIQDQLENRLAEEGMSHGRFILLMLLNRKPTQPVPASKLADQAGITKQTVTGLLDGLEADGLIARQGCPDDRRKCLIRLMPKARRYLDRILPTLQRCQASYMMDLSEAERGELVRLLGKIRLDGTALVHADVKMEFTGALASASVNRTEQARRLNDKEKDG